MKRTIITIDAIKAAKSQGLAELAVPYSGVVTPAARDMAASLGIVLIRGECPAKGMACGQATKSPRAPEKTKQTDALFATVKERVVSRLPAALRDNPALDEIVRKSLASATVEDSRPAAAPTPNPVSLITPKGETMPLIVKCAALCRKQPRRIVFPDALDARALTAAGRLKQEGLAEPVLIGNPARLTAMAKDLGVSLSGISCVDHEDAAILEANAREYLRIARENGKPVSVEAAVEYVRSPVAAGALLLKKGEADLGIAGNLTSTADVLRAGLRLIGTRAGTRTVFGLFYLVSPKNDVSVFADCAVIPEPTAEQLADIAVTSALSYTALTGGAAKVAMLSFSTKGSAEHPRVGIVREGLKIAKSRDASLVIDGELQFDAAVCPTVAELKAPGSPLGGKANVFVFPSLEAANIGYKIAQRFGNYTALGPFLAGFDKGWHDLSRGCSAEDIYKIAVTGTALSSGDKAR